MYYHKTYSKQYELCIVNKHNRKNYLPYFNNIYSYIWYYTIMRNIFHFTFIKYVLHITFYKEIPLCTRF